MWDIPSHLLTAAAGGVAVWLFKDLVQDPFANARRLRFRALTMLAEYGNEPPRGRPGLITTGDRAGQRSDARTPRLIEAQDTLRKLGIELSTFAKINRGTDRFYRFLKIDLGTAGAALIDLGANMDKPGMDRAHYRQIIHTALRLPRDRA